MMCFFGWISAAVKKVSTFISNSMHLFSNMKRAYIILLVVISSTWTVSAAKFLPDDPLWHDADCQAVREPEEVEFSKTFNLMANTFGRPGNKEAVRAANINTLGEVPDSNWFTNRMGRNPLSSEELLRGPNTASGPDPSQPWTI